MVDNTVKAGDFTLHEISTCHGAKKEYNKNRYRKDNDSEGYSSDCLSLLNEDQFSEVGPLLDHYKVLNRGASLTQLPIGDVSEGETM